MGGLLLRAGLEIADFVVRSLPARAAYALAALVGRAWYRFAGDRRALVSQTMARVSEAVGLPTEGPAFRQMVERAFVEHARYWAEVLRAPHYRREDLDRIVSVEPASWEALEDVFRKGAVIAVPHMGNFEPFGYFVVNQGLRVTAPIEETEPPQLFEFLMARRVGAQPVNIVPLRRATRPMIAALKRGEIAAMVADRDLGRGGVPVTMFGHATTLAPGPATLALRHGRPLVMGRVLRTGPDRFVARAELVTAELTGDFEADVAALTRALAASFERAIAEAPEQWWASFQPFFTDQRRLRGQAA